jgi:hypothetical protein
LFDYPIIIQLIFIMASVQKMIHRLHASSNTALDLSNKFYKVVQDLPSAVDDYTDFAEHFLYISDYLEQIWVIIPTVNPTRPPLPPIGPPQSIGIPPPLPPVDSHRDSKLFKDLVTLLDFLDDAYADSKEGLPQRYFDGADVDLLLPNEVDMLLEQIEALGIASKFIFSVIQAGTCYRPPPGAVGNSTKVTEGFVNQIRRMIRTLTLSQPKELNNRSRSAVRPCKRGKTHTAITQFLAEMLKVQATKSSEDTAGDTAESEKSSKNEESSGSDDNEAESVEKVNTVRFERIGRDPILDQDQYRTTRHPDQLYAKVPVKDVDEASLKYFGLPYTKPKVCVLSS